MNQNAVKPIRNTKKIEIMKTIASYFMMSCLCFMLIFSGIANAQEIEVSPGSMMFTANPGSSQTQQIYVRNKAKTEQSFVFNIADWLTDESGEVKYFSPGSVSRSCAEWVTITPSLVTLQPNESVGVNVTMLVPEGNNATKWAVVFVESAEERTGPEAIDKDVRMGLQVAARIAVPVFQSPSSNTLYKGTIEGLSEKVTDTSRIYQSKVINLGDKILNCKVFFTVSNLETAEEFTSEPIEFSVLPESSKDVEYALEEKLDKGRYSVAAILDYGYNEELEGIQLEIEVK